jgi:hypothetical protein
MYFECQIMALVAALCKQFNTAVSILFFQSNNSVANIKETCQTFVI